MKTASFTPPIYRITPLGLLRAKGHYALNGITWKDDVQIVDAILSRRYGPESVTVIEVRPL